MKSEVIAFDRISPACDAGATFSDCRSYRYDLWRQWNASRNYAVFIGLNPSTADERADDPTIRRCVGFSQRWGFGAFCMVNLDPFRATDPRAMLAHKTPPEIMATNDRAIGAIACFAGIVIAAWGVHSEGREAGALHQVKNLPSLHHLGLTKAGHPKHPLYLRGDTLPIRWT